MNQNSNLYEAATCGGKGAMLLRLRAAGFPVPQFVVLPLSFFTNNNTNDLLTICRQALPEWEAFFGSSALLAVRSSGTAEDGQQHSFAGQFSTELNVALAAVPEAICTVWASGSNSRVSAYRQQAGISDSGKNMAVILQLMVPATASGVAFSSNPLGRADEAVVNAITGLGDRLVDGSATADQFVIQDGQIIRQDIRGATPALTVAQALTAARCAQQVAATFGGPQDIEFAFKDDAFYLLQARPITTAGKAAQITWDNSNIVESYPGLTLPLTFSFIEKMYASVYRQFSLVLGIRPKKVAASNAIYSTMLGLLNGRVYYNLNSWYGALALLPGYTLNAGFMEQMMGVKGKPDIRIAGNRQSRISAWLDVARAAAHILYNLATASKQRRRFIHAFDAIYSGFSNKDYGAATTQEIRTDYQRFETLMLREWKAPLANDFFAMIYFGMLQKSCAKYVPAAPDLHNRLLAHSEDIITTRPLKLLPCIAAAMAAHPALKTACANSDAAGIWNLLQQAAYSDTLAQIEAYIDAWGERCMAELKLETISYRQQPKLLIGILQGYVNAGIFSYQSGANTLQQRQSAEQQLIAHAGRNPWRRFLLRHVLCKARYFVSNRENLRYYRTLGFGMVRRMLLALGGRMAATGQIDTARDVFYLKMEEAMGKDDTALFTGIVAQRKAQYEAYAAMPLPERIITNGRQETILLPPDISKQCATNDSENTWQGIACSPGVVRGTVRLLRHADELQSLDGAILVTYATDPGYVVLFATASGILTERGSLLSHAAIVSREMGLPCVSAIEGIMDELRDGDEIIMDGSTGVVQRIKSIQTS